MGKHKTSQEEVGCSLELKKLGLGEKDGLLCLFPLMQGSAAVPPHLNQALQPGQTSHLTAIIITIVNLWAVGQQHRVGRESMHGLSLWGPQHSTGAPGRLTAGWSGEASSEPHCSLRTGTRSGCKDTSRQRSHVLLD